MAFYNDGQLGNWVAYLHADGSLAVCVQLHQNGQEHRQGRVSTRGFASPEEAYIYLNHDLNMSAEKIRFYVASPEQFYLTVCLAGPHLPLQPHQILKGLSPISFVPF